MTRRESPPFMAVSPDCLFRTPLRWLGIGEVPPEAAHSRQVSGRGRGSLAWVSPHLRSSKQQTKNTLPSVAAVDRSPQWTWEAQGTEEPGVLSRIHPGGRAPPAAHCRQTLRRPPPHWDSCAGDVPTSCAKAKKPEFRTRGSRS